MTGNRRREKVYNQSDSSRAARIRHRGEYILRLTHCGVALDRGRSLVSAIALFVAEDEASGPSRRAGFLDEETEMTDVSPPTSSSGLAGRSFTVTPQTDTPQRRQHRQVPTAQHY